MFNYEVFLFMLLLCSVLTSLIVEAIKKMIDKPRSNILAAIVSVCLGIAVPTAYMIWTGATMDNTWKAAVFVVALALMSWLSAMLGYDKIMQAITQIKAK